MKIAITINGILRDVNSKIKYVFEKYNDTTIEDISSEDNLQEKLGFSSQTEVYNFLYVDASMEIFGHSKETEHNIFNQLNDLVMDRDVEFFLISDELGKGVPATLWFLAKYGSLCKNIKFYTTHNLNKLLKEFDYIITKDKNIISQVKNSKTKIINYDSSLEESTDDTLNKLNNLKTILNVKSKSKRLTTNNS